VTDPPGRARCMGSQMAFFTPAAKGAKAMHGVGKYIVVWKKQADGSYKILRDIANSDQAMK